MIINATAPRLLKVTAVALVAAAVLRVTTVRPAECGIDSTAIGKALGLAALHSPATDARFTARFDSSPGWYWKNKGTEPVTITAKVSNYSQKLYRLG